MTEEPLSQSEKNHWDKLAELLGIKPSAEPQPSQEDVARGEQAAQLETAQTPQECSQDIASQRGDQIAPEKTPVVPDSIPLRRTWVTKPRSAGNWDEIIGQLGLSTSAASPTPVSASVEPSGVSADAVSVPPQATGEKVSPELTAEGEARPVLTPLEQTIVPPALEEASVVALATPEEKPPIVQEEVTPPGEWLEEQVVAPVEVIEEAEEVWPQTHDILDIKDSRDAVAADTLLVTEVPQVLQDKELGEPEGKRGEKKGRKRHRRKKKSRAPVTPEPFEEELPEIVELATTGEDNGTTAESSPSQGMTVGAGRERTASAKADRKKRPRPSHDVAEDAAEAEIDAGEADEDDEAAEISRPSHKAIPGWAEVVGYVIEKNLEARSRRPNHRDRRR
ncbi:MAG TPA: hypothetical protein PLD05_14115 [Thermogutta sp.]|nr:hypothetical protein [Thermogutta sp.]